MSSNVMKYIVYHTSNGLVPVIFPKTIAHIKMAQTLGSPEIRSAGFVRMDLSGNVCYGSSFTLNKDSTPGDSTLLCDNDKEDGYDVIIRESWERHNHAN